MIYTFSELIQMIQTSTIPNWVRDHVFSKKDEMAAALQKDKRYEIVGPGGEIVEIRFAKSDYKKEKP